MRKIFTFVLALVCFGTVFGQSNVYLKINHKLAAANFAMNTAAQNNLGNDFNVSRLEYYLSQITIIHDGGTETLVPNFWILVNGDTPVNELLGSFNITNLEGVKFGVGVEQAVNHLDPSQYAMSHPLAPKSPSMHWGWNAGYRFVAMEGYAGSGFNQNYQIHALGDVNYWMTTVTTTGSMNGNDIIIDLDADYTQALRDINVSSGLINHGETGEAVTTLNNFRDHVFSEASGSVSVNPDQGSSGLTVYPNPSNGAIRLNVDGPVDEGMQVFVRDLNGKTLRTEMLPANGKMDFEIATPGFYFVTLTQNNRVLATQKLVVQ